MSKMIQIRNVSDEVHAELVRRAKSRGLTLTAYLEELIKREVARPAREDVFDRIEARPTIDLGVSAAELIREGRREAGRE